MTRLFASLLLFFPVAILQAQGPSLPPGKGAILGLVVDAETGEPLPFANVALFSEPDSLFLDGATTQENGAFRIGPLDFGNYRISVTMVGYETLDRPNLQLDQNQPLVRLGKISLSQGALDLSEVEITAQREAVEFGLDKKVFNIERNATLAGANALDALQTIPSVTVDVDGNISLRGSSNVRILINGKPSGLTGFDRSAILRQIPANTILYVEVLNNPSAKYDPEGTSGVINIVTKQQNNQGFNLTAQANVGTRNKYDGTVALNYRTGPVNIFGSYAGRADQRFFRSERTRTNLFSDTTYALNQESYDLDQDINHTFKAGADLFLSQRATVNTAFTYRPTSENETGYVLSDFIDENGLLTNKSDRGNINDESGNLYEWEASYRQLFRREKQELTAAFRFSSGNRINTSDLQEDFLTPDGQFLYDDRQQTFSENKNQLLLGQVDFVRPLQKIPLKLETGWRSSLQQLGNDFVVEDYDPLSGEYLTNPLVSNNFRYDEGVHALYGMGSLSLKKWEAQAGVRVEQTYTTSELITTNEVFNNDYFSVFPSGYLAFLMPNDQRLQFSFSRRINRPSSRALNPFVDFSDTLNIRTGNPFLLPEYTLATELSYNRSFKKGTISPAIYVRRITDIIQRFSIVQDNGVRLQTWENLQSGLNMGLEVVATYRPFKWWSMNGNINLYRTQVDGSNLESALTNEGYMGSMMIMSVWSFWKDFSIQLMGMYRTRGVNVQGESDAFYGMDLALRKGFLKNRLNLSMRLSDVFNTRDFGFTSSGENFTSYNFFKRETQIGYIGLSYSLRPENRKGRQDTRRENFEGDMDF